MFKSDAEIQSDQAGQPGTTPENQVDSNGSTQQVPDADAIAAAEAIRRKAQSEFDREAARIAKEYRDWKAKGNTGTVEQMLQGIQGIQTQPGDQIQKPAADANEANANGSSPDPVVQRAMFIMDEYAGGMIPEDAPEFKMIDQKTNDQNEFLTSVRKASQAYAERTKNIANPARIPALAGGSGTHTPNHTKLSGTETLDKAFSDLGFG